MKPALPGAPLPGLTPSDVGAGLKPALPGAASVRHAGDGLYPRP